MNIQAMRREIYGLVLASVFILSGCENSPDAPFLELWYEQPAREWMEALPIGNGRLGAMIYGGIEKETIALNESSLWSGGYDPCQEQAFGKEKLKDLRQLFFDGKLVEGNDVAARHLTGTPHSSGTHLPVGNLLLNFSCPVGNIDNYRRSLDLSNAVCKVSFTANGINYKREYIGSNPDDILLIHLSADKAESINFEVELHLFHEAQIKSREDGLIFSGKADFPQHESGGVSFVGMVGIKTDGGEIRQVGEKITVSTANSATIAIDIRTDYKDNNYPELCNETLMKALKKSYHEIYQAHIIDYQPLFKRVEMCLGRSEYEHLPTDIRWRQLRKGINDVGMDALFFQYGRYLLIASSRENSPLPASLQGVWNDNLACHMEWTNDYHLNINTQQNYWIANIGNLHECNAPLFRYIKDLSEHGSKTVSTIYGAKGWTAHTTANIRGYTAPSSGINRGLFPTAGSWITSHLWTHYQYTSDNEFLQKVAYPLLKGNATFLLDYMVENPYNGYLMTGPSISPGNWFHYKGENLVASMMPACDRQLAYEIFHTCLKTARILDTDAFFADSLEIALSKLPPIMIGKNGTIQEWFEDYEEVIPDHRHTSHLLALYPFSQITLERTPELANAARKTIEDRLAADGCEDTGWRRANMICFYARLKDAEQAYYSIRKLQQDFTRENLMSMSSAGIAENSDDIFILDGNTAGAAGIAEMLVQAHEGYIELLPALPAQWSEGHYSGLCVPGGGEVSVKWNNGKVREATLKATVSNTFTFRIPEGKEYKVTLNSKKLSFNTDEKFLRVKMSAGDLMKIE